MMDLREEIAKILRDFIYAEPKHAGCEYVAIDVIRARGVRFPENRYKPHMPLESEIDELVIERDRYKEALQDLLAIIHRDGGHHTGEVGIEQSVTDAKMVVSNLVVQQDEVEGLRIEKECSIMEDAHSHTPCKKCKGVGYISRPATVAEVMERVKGMVETAIRIKEYADDHDDEQIPMWVDEVLSGLSAKEK